MISSVGSDSNAAMVGSDRWEDNADLCDSCSQSRMLKECLASMLGTMPGSRTAHAKDQPCE